MAIKQTIYFPNSSFSSFLIKTLNSCLFLIDENERSDFFPSKFSSNIPIRCSKRSKLYAISIRIFCISSLKI